MGDSRFFEAAKTVGFKGPLTEGCFVGRQKEVQALRSAILGSQITPLWIFGPRRIGKSSLSNKIADSKGVRVTYVSCDQTKWTSLDGFFDFLAREISAGTGREFGSSGKAVFKELADASCSADRVILILDGFDGIAVNMQQDEQAFIRTTLQAHPYFGVVFISRLKPQQLLQDYSDENSRLLGVCGFVKVPMLSIGDIVELKQCVEEICGDPIGGWFPQWTYERVGGYPVAVQGLFREYLLLADRLDAAPSLHQVENEEDSFFERVEFDLKGLWNDFPFEIRQALKDGGNPSGEVARELKSLNMFKGKNAIHRPTWLLNLVDDVGKDVYSEGQEHIPLAEKLFEYIKRCNDIALRRGFSQVFQVTQTALSIFSIARNVRSENELTERVNLLHKMCVEGTDSKKLKGDQCLIPKEVRPIYKKSDGFNVLVAYRNFSFHDASQDLSMTEVSKRYTNIGSICCKYLGPGRFKPNNGSDYDKIYKGMLMDVIDSVAGLEKALVETR